MTEEIITIADVRRAGYCIRGTRQLYSDKAKDELSFRDFLKNGITVSRAREHSGMDAIIDHVLRVKRAAGNE